MYFEGETIPVPKRIGNWLLQDKLGSGFSGAIYKAFNPYNGQVAAIKLQHVDHECPTNQYEQLFYPALQGGTGMPTLWASGVHGIFEYLVIDLLGPSLDSLYRQNNKTMDLRSVLSIGLQVLSRLEFMHNRGVLHRDIQLGNCVIGLGPHAGTIFMIDFGFSKFYMDRITRRHIPDSRKKRDFIGNYWFSSVNVHCRGRVPSRRDDLEALALMLIHLLTPNGLPWTRNGVPMYSYQGDMIISEKLRARPEDLCHGLPDLFKEFLRYCRRLKFAECPDYAFWREEFAGLAEDHGFVDHQGRVTDQFFWPPIVPKPVRRAQAESDLNAVLRMIAQMDLNGGRVNIPDNVQSAQIYADSGSTCIQFQRNLPGPVRQEIQITFYKQQQHHEEEEEEEEDEDELSYESNISSYASDLDELADEADPPPPPVIIPRAASVPPVETLSDGSTTDGSLRTPLDASRGSSRPVPSVASSNETNVENPAAPPAKTRPAAGAAPPPKKPQREIILISSEEESGGLSKRQGGRMQKATAFSHLTSRVAKATDNAGLGRLMKEFIEVLQANSSKFMTKEGFAFLDALECQLSDPELFEVNAKQRARAMRSTEPLGGLPRHASNLEAMKYLRARIAAYHSLGNLQVGEMLGLFTKVLRRSGARTVTKDGFAFLVGLEGFLQRT